MERRRSPEHAPAVEPPAAVVAEAQAIEDPELRRQFLKTAAAYLGRRSGGTSAKPGSGNLRDD